MLLPSVRLFRLLEELRLAPLELCSTDTTILSGAVLQLCNPKLRASWRSGSRQRLHSPH